MTNQNEWCFNHTSISQFEPLEWIWLRSKLYISPVKPLKIDLKNFHVILYCNSQLILVQDWIWCSLLYLLHCRFHSGLVLTAWALLCFTTDLFNSFIEWLNALVDLKWRTRQHKSNSKVNLQFKAFPKGSIILVRQQLQ